MLASSTGLRVLLQVCARGSLRARVPVRAGVGTGARARAFVLVCMHAGVRTCRCICVPGCARTPLPVLGCAGVPRQACARPHVCIVGTYARARVCAGARGGAGGAQAHTRVHGGTSMWVKVPPGEQPALGQHGCTGAEFPSPLAASYGAGPRARCPRGTLTPPFLPAGSVQGSYRASGSPPAPRCCSGGLSAVRGIGRPPPRLAEETFWVPRGECRVRCYLRPTGLSEREQPRWWKKPARSCGHGRAFCTKASSCRACFKEKTERPQSYFCCDKT